MQKAARYRAQARSYPDRADELTSWAKRFEQMAVWMQPEEGMSMPTGSGPTLPHARMLDPRTWAEHPELLDDQPASTRSDSPTDKKSRWGMPRFFIL
ncbi:MAG: hypothetical protein Alpg2KO_32790 [Alphaproteobacteria bacterium]